MAVEQRDFRVERGMNRLGQEGEPPLRELIRQLSEDASELVRQEVGLVKAELRENAKSHAKDATKIGMSIGIGLLGGMAALAFEILGLGALIDNYWLSALIVTVVLLAVAAIMGKGAMNRMKERGLKPKETMETLRADAEWAKREVEVVKRELKSDGSRSPVEM
jgi:uncharacterized membrane protein YqjE